ncbi:DUF515 domain-containing protein [Methanothermococcus okinawensis]|uniref:Protein G-related albumin-binding (GA) module domain-containing protein n=1 Tax=Methanothermococcus okinawensis (strain DSM 14208 / JCM 11175 / IH1) TaxID=647113 RepID=F8ALN4_METOI|nr:DUF515 domain-containing protein [Methanothermococcus okinawensis]AEH06582.1 protein of unknown function DUF515 [Methanothermococcus okinawensis IH1]
MVNEDFGNKLKKLKSKTKRSSGDKSKYIKYVALFIIIAGISFVAYNMYNANHSKQIQKEKAFENSKNMAINNINQIFSKYPNDPNKVIYISQIQNSNTHEELSKILISAKNYVDFKNYKEEMINSIKTTYGKYYDGSFYAKSLVSQIESANSRSEVDKILRNSNIEENAREYYLKGITSELTVGNYFSVKIGNREYLMSRAEILEHVKKLSLSELKGIKIIPVSFDKITIVVSAMQCGKIPYEGDKILIYDKSNASKNPIEGVVNASYVVLKDISYSETKSVSSSLNDNGDSASASSSSSISYSLNNLPGVLYATAANKLDYNKINEKFGRYGEKLNKIQSDTQIFDGNVKYLLILSIPSDSVSKIISMKSSNAYIVKAG